MDEYIRKEDALRVASDVFFETDPEGKEQLVALKCSHLIRELPAADVVPVEALKNWLWKVALNNSDNYLGDACAELVSRLDGLRRYAKEVESENIQSSC